MSKIRSIHLFFIFLFALLFIPLSSISAASPPSVGDVVINEYVARSSTTEWVELYNTTASDLDISGHYIDDVASGGGAPKQILNSTIIPAGGYYVMEFNNLLNNGGDDVRFLDASQAALDSTSYTSATDGILLVSYAQWRQLEWHREQHPDERDGKPRGRYIPTRRGRRTH